MNKTEKCLSESELKRFAVFAGDDFYPFGGWADLVASFDDAEIAVAWIRDQARVIPLGDTWGTSSKYHQYEPRPCYWWQVVDLQTRKLIAASRKPEG